MNKLLLAGLLTSALSASAWAQPYGLISVGTSHLNVDCTGTSTCDKNDTAVKGMLGYKFHPNWAAELGYFDYGKARATVPGVSGEIGNTATGLGIAYHQEFAKNWGFVARLGVARVRTRVSGTVTDLGSASDTDTHSNAYGGLGLSYRLSRSVSLDGVWDFSRSRYARYGADESGDIHAFSVGLTFGF
jgi:OOP family OmpA-OmpF porin